ncbi:MAG: hypothetical protein P8Y42_16805, partial [Exilibacterium sp.]
VCNLTTKCVIFLSRDLEEYSSFVVAMKALGGLNGAVSKPHGYALKIYRYWQKTVIKRCIILASGKSSRLAPFGRRSLGLVDNSFLADDSKVGD